MKVKGLLFRDDEVRAIREGRKTLTSRPINPQPGEFDRVFRMDDGSWHVCDSRGGHQSPICCPLSPGDVAYVREAFDIVDDPADGTVIDYRADNPRRVMDIMRERGLKGPKVRGWHPSTKMRRKYSRLTLPVVEVWPARVQDTTPADAIAEGILPSANFATIDCDTPSPVDGFRSLWNSLYAKPKPIAGGAFGDALCYVSYPFSGESRDETYRGKPHHICANPWRWCVRFRVVEANVDEYLRSAAA